MATLIKDKSLIIKPTKKNVSGGNDYTIRNQLPTGETVKLSHVFNYLPAGIIDKTETGIGGTSLELAASRHSIIVEPFVRIAHTKANQKSTLYNHEVHFYGKKPDNKTSVSKLNVKNKPTQTPIYDDDPDNKLFDYITKCKESHKSVKIICVTDQLESLKDFLNKTTNYKLNKFHLVLDEIDCLQEHSNFRRVMEICVEIYKDHPKQRRTLISATIKTFHDPDLKKERLTKISYQNPTKKKILLIRPAKLMEEVFKQVKAICAQQQGKLVIACNHVEYCYKLAEKIKAEPTLKGNSVKILCGLGSQIKVNHYFDEILADGLLPARINLITSAYFNGLDILEPYHNIIVADGLRPTLRLSTDVIYQIVGRCRHKLLSSRLIVKVRPQKGYKYNSLPELEEQSEEMCLVDKIFQKLKKSKNPNVFMAAQELQGLIVSGSRHFYSLCSVNSEGVLVKSYLKIDSRLEQEVTHKNYETHNNFIKALKTRFDFKIMDPLSSQHDDEFKSIDPAIEGLRILKEIRSLPLGTDYEDAMKHKFVENKHLKDIYTICYLADQLPNISITKLDLLITSAIGGPTLQNLLKKLHVLLEFHLNILNKQTPVSRAFSSFFPLNTKQPRTYYEGKCDDLYELTNKSRGVRKNQTTFFNLIATKPSLIMDSVLELKSTRSNKARYCSIVGYNKFDIFV